MAAYLGIDPRSYLHSVGEETVVLGKVYERAAQLRSESKKNEVKAIGSWVGQAIAKLFRK